jgi:hypothetical protein
LKTSATLVPWAESGKHIQQSSAYAEAAVGWMGHNKEQQQQQA